MSTTGSARGDAMDPEFAVLGAQSPITSIRLPLGGNAWLVSRHADVRKVLADSRFTRRLAEEPSAPSISSVPYPNSSILRTDPEYQARIRGIIAHQFTERRVTELRSGAEQVLNDLADNLESGPRPADFVAAVAEYFPALVISKLLGISESALRTFARWTKQLRTLGITSADPEDGMLALDQMAQSMRNLVTARRVDPADDLISALAGARDGHGQLTDDELVSFGILLLAGGVEATADIIARSVYILLTRPGQYRRVRDNPQLIPTAIEEFVRCIPGVHANLPYVASVDVELDGVTIRKGDAVVVSDIFGNSDQLDRAPGVHHCLGAQLTRVELKVLLTMLPHRFPNLALAVPSDQVRWKNSSLLRGPAQLPVTW